MKKRYNISLSAEARKKLEAIAEKEKRSLSMMIEMLILKGEVKK